MQQWRKQMAKLWVAECSLQNDTMDGILSLSGNVFEEHL